MTLLVIKGIEELRSKIDEGVNLVDDEECFLVWIASNCWLAPECLTNDVHFVTGVNDVLKVKLVLPPELRINSTLDFNCCCISAENIIIVGIFVWVQIRTLHSLVESLIAGVSQCIVLVLHVNSFHISIHVIINCCVIRKNL
jgi:hypothetical protein